MLKFIAQRILFTVLVLIGIVFAVYLGMDMASNSEVDEPEYNLVVFSKEAWQDTKDFFEGILKGDWGIYVTPAGGQSVKDILRDAFVNSMGLLALALGGAALVGLLLGGIAALRKQASLGTLTLTIIGISAPSFFVALLLQRIVIWHTRVYGQTLSVGGFGWDYQHLLLPVLVLSARPLAYLTRSSFLSLGRIMEEDFIRTAFAKGLRRHTVINVHALRNIAIPVLTAIGVSLRFSLGSLPVVEFFFGWPGMGFYLLNAINERQTSVVVALAFIIGLTLLLVNLGLDILYRLVDPRLREEG